MYTKAMRRFIPKVLLLLALTPDVSAGNNPGQTSNSQAIPSDSPETPYVVIIPRTARSAVAERLRLFISAPTRNGFIDIDQGILDSIADIRNQLERSKQIVVVDGGEKADITLTVVKRGIGSEQYAERLTDLDYFGQAELAGPPLAKNAIWVTTVVEIGNHRREFTGQHRDALGAFWSKCAKQIANDLEVWIQSNAPQLRQHLASR
jgi:hypothetical protein